MLAVDAVCVMSYFKVSISYRETCVKIPLYIRIVYKFDVYISGDGQLYVFQLTRLEETEVLVSV